MFRGFWFFIFSQRAWKSAISQMSLVHIEESIFCSSTIVEIIQQHRSCFVVAFEAHSDATRRWRSRDPRQTIIRCSESPPGDVTRSVGSWFGLWVQSCIKEIHTTFAPRQQRRISAPSVALMGGAPRPLQPRGGSRLLPGVAPAGGSYVGAGCRAGWRAAPPGCRGTAGDGCRRKRSAASWSGSGAAFPAAGPCQDTHINVSSG